MSVQIKLGRFSRAFLPLIALFFAVAHAQESPAPSLPWRIVHTLPHDATRFTQGLAIEGEMLYESTGRYGKSALFAQPLHGTPAPRSHALAPDVFGEGLALLKGRIFQLSWLNRRGFIYDLALHPQSEFSYDGEGWGLAQDGRQLIMSDGSARLRWLDAATQKPLRDVVVHDGGRAVNMLNELEYVDGVLYANVWMTDRIAAIDPQDGSVRGWLELAPLKKGFAKPRDWDEAANVLNGIAWDPATRHFYVTGKCWPVMYELEVQPPAQR